MEEQNLENTTDQTISANAQIVETVDFTSGDNSTQIRYAGFWIRFVATFIDGIIVGIVLLLISISNLLIFPEGFSLNKIFHGANFIGYLVAWGYYVFMTDKYQATLGKKAVGIKVVSENFTKASLGRIVLRETIGKIISGFILAIGYIMAAFSNRKRALHDIIANTVVVYK